MIYADELAEITRQFFKDMGRRLPPGISRKDDANVYDNLVIGWTRYWNEVLQPDVPLDPVLVKALIETESHYDPTATPKKTRAKGAFGLMQLMPSAIKALGDVQGELRDHFVVLKKTDLNDPSVQIAAGIRWLFNKRRLASRQQKRVLSWEETVLDYKGYRPAKKSGAPMKGLNRFLEVYRRMKES